MVGLVATTTKYSVTNLAECVSYVNGSFSRTFFYGMHACSRAAVCMLGTAKQIRDRMPGLIRFFARLPWCGHEPFVV